MYSLLAYIMQVNILLAIVYLGYAVLLRKLTFYRLNRTYFLTGVVFAFVYPFLDVKSLFQRHIDPVGEWMGYFPHYYMEEVERSVYTLENALHIFIGIGAAWFGIRLCIQLLSVLRIHLYSRKAIWKTYWYQHVLFPVVPFSFLNKVYLHREQHPETELHDIFEHEDIHVKGLHSMDIIMFEMLLVVCWYNPFVWLMRRAVRQNLEYLTDQQVLNKGVDRQTYQYSLLQVSKQGASLGLSNQFNFKFLKKRIMMMNKKKSSKLQLSKYAFLLPVIIFSAGAFTISKADGKITDAVEAVKDVRLDAFKPKNPIAEQATQPLVAFKMSINPALAKMDTVKKAKEPIRSLGKNPLYIVDGKQMILGFGVDELKPEDIHNLEVLKGGAAIEEYGVDGRDGVIKVTTKKWAKENPDKVKEDSSKKKKEIVSVGYGSKNEQDTVKGKGEKVVKMLKSKSEIDQTRDYLYLYDDKELSKDAFLQIDDAALYGMTFMSKDLLKQRYPDHGDKDGVVSAYSVKENKRRKEERDKALVVIDGEIQKEGKAAMDAIAPDEIVSIDVLKDKSAVNKYGDQAKYGAVEITTKTAGRADDNVTEIKRK